MLIFPPFPTTRCFIYHQQTLTGSCAYSKNPALRRVDTFARMAVSHRSMRLSRAAASVIPCLRRGVALLSVGLVLLLSVSSVSPELHTWLHVRFEPEAAACAHHAHAKHVPQTHDDGDRSDPTHDCAVTLFSHGVVHHSAALLALPCEGILRAVNYRAFERLALAQPRYLHLPPQAPPAV